MSSVKAMQAVRAAVQAANNPDLGQVSVGLSESLDMLSTSMGASRACLCFFGHDDRSDVVDRYYTGGHANVLPVGPALLGVSLRQIPELLPVLNASVDCVVVEMRTASESFVAHFQEIDADWIVGTAVREDEQPVSVLFLLGSGAPPNPQDVPCVALSTISEVVRPVVKTSPNASIFDLDSPVLAAVESLGLGIVVLDGAGHVQSLNEAAALMLGGTMSGLHKQEIRIGEWSIRSPEGDVVLSSDFSRMHREDSPWCQPIDIRFRNRRGRSVCCRVSLRKDMTVRDPLAPQIVVLMHELPGYDGINDGSNDADLRALMRQIQSTLDDLQIAKGVLDPPRDPATFGLLSAREREVLDYLLDGVRVSTIADRLYLSQHTVRNHLRSIFKKLGVNSQAEVIRLARGMN